MSLNKIITIFVIIFILFIGIIFYQLNRRSPEVANQTATSTKLSTSKVTIHNTSYTIDIAKTQKERENGLSNRPSLAQDQGMLFIFDTPAVHSFWMKDMKFPIDIIFIRGDKVVSIVENAPPPKSQQGTLPLYSSEAPADKVLEINAGHAKKNNIKKGDSVKIEL